MSGFIKNVYLVHNWTKKSRAEGPHLLGFLDGGNLTVICWSIKEQSCPGWITSEAAPTPVKAWD